MEEFNLSKINLYSIDELVEYILSGSTTKEQLYKNGLFRPNRPLLEKALEVREEEDWNDAETAGTPDAISDYLNRYDKDEPYYRGKHIDEAKTLNLAPIREDDITVEIDKPNTVSEIETEDNNAALSSLLSSLQYYSNKKELSLSDNESWLKATSKNTVHSYEEYLRIYKNNPWGYVGKHVEDAKIKLLQLQEVTDWLQTTLARTKIAYNKYISKYEPIKHLLTSNHLDDAKNWIKSQNPTPWSKFLKNAVKFGSLCVIACLCVWVYNYFTKPDVPQPLSQDEIAEIIKVKQDSLKIELFDGFYLTPAIIGQSNRDMAICSEIDSDINSSDSEPSGPISKEEVLANYVSTLNGKFNIANKDGVILELPEAQNGIDSVCLKNAPFLEYIDNNGLRRVVALFKDDVYYYLGECGGIDNLNLYILSNKNNNYGIINSRGVVVKDFCNDKIYQTSNGFVVKNNGQEIEYDNTGEKIIKPQTSSTSQTVTKTVSHDYLQNYRAQNGLWGYKDKDGNIKIKPSYKSCPWKFDGNKEWVVSSTGKSQLINRSGKVLAEFDGVNDSYVVNGNVKVSVNNSYGIYNQDNLKIIVPTIYEDISLYGYATDMFPAKKNGKWGYVKAGGAIAIPFKFNEAYSFGADSKLAVVKDENGKCGYIDFDGNYKIPAQYYSGGTMSSDGARVMRSSTEYGYITKSGNLIASWYPYMSQKFVLDRIFVRNSNQLGGFVNRQNKLVIPYMFDAKSEPVFNENSHLAKVMYSGIEWYINTNGAFCYPASSNLKPSEQNIQVQIAAAKEREEKEQAKRASKVKNSNDRNRS